MIYRISQMMNYVADVHRMTSLMGSKYKMMKAEGCTKSRIDSYDWMTLVIDLVDL